MLSSAFLESVRLQLQGLGSLRHKAHTATKLLSFGVVCCVSMDDQRGRKAHPWTWAAAQGCQHSAIGEAVLLLRKAGVARAGPKHQVPLCQPPLASCSWARCWDVALKHPHLHRKDYKASLPNRDFARIRQLMCQGMNVHVKHQGYQCCCINSKP